MDRQMVEGEAMTTFQRKVYLLMRGWTSEPTLRKPWSRPNDWKRRTLLGAFMRQQAADARAEREAEGR